MSRRYRFIAEAMLGRPLRAEEVVHHVNGDRTDNRPENLEVLDSQGRHMLEHRRTREFLTPSEVAQLIASGMTKKQLLAVGVSENLYVEGRAVLGLPRKSRRNLTRLGLDTPRQKQHTFDWDEAKRLRAQGLTLRQIAAELGVTHSAIRYACDRG